MNSREALKTIDVFKSLEDKQIEELSRFTRVKTYEDNDFIIYKGEDGDDLFIVLEGECRGVLIDDDGDEILLSKFEANDIFGEMSLIDKKGRTGTIVANGNVTLAKINRKGIMSILSQSPEICLVFLEMLVDRLRKADELIESLAFLNVKERIMKQFIDEAEESGEQVRNFFKIEKCTHQDISSKIGASRESVTKCLKILTLEGLIKIKDDHILVKKPTAIF